MSSLIRSADIDDIPALVDLMTAFYAEAGYALPREPARHAFSTLIAAGPGLGRVWLILEQKLPVGYLVLTFSFSMEYGGLRAFVDDFFVQPHARNQGLGGLALSKARDACLEHGVRALLVETGPDDHPARGVYARAGFEDTGRVLLYQTLLAPLHDSAE